MVTRATRNALAAAQNTSVTAAPPTPSPKKAPAALPKKMAKTPASMTPSKAKSKRASKAKVKAKANAKRKIEEDESDQEEEEEEPKKPVGVAESEDEEVEVVDDEEEHKIDDSESDDDNDDEEDEDEDDANDDEDEDEEDSKKGEAHKPVGSTKLLTSRQRAMLDGTTRKGSFPLALPDLPPKSGKRKAETEDELFRKAENAAKRKRQAQRQLEEEKNAVIDRLLNFTRRKADDGDAKSTTSDDLPSSEAQQSTIRCVWRSPTSTKNRRVHSKATSVPCTNFLCFPEVVGLPSELCQKPSPKPGPSIQCAVCQKHPRRYDCSKTKLPLCSLSCYRNLHSLQR